MSPTMCRRYRGTLSCVVRASGGEAHSHLSCVRMVTVPSLGGGLEAKNILFFPRFADPVAPVDGRALADLWWRDGADVLRLWAGLTGDEVVLEVCPTF